jgi:hypothetical protein
VAYPVNLQTLQARVLQRANLEGAGQFIPPQELTDYINASIAEFVDEVRGTTWGGTYTRSSYSFNTANNTQVYALPQDFLSMLSVDVFITQGSPVISALAYQEEQRNIFRNYPVLFGWGYAHPVYYQIQGPNISFIPTPLGAYQVTLNYIPTAPVLTDPDDSIDSVNGWEEMIVCDAAIKCLTKAGELESIPEIKAEREHQRERIRAMAARRDQSASEHVHVIANRGFSDWDW